MQENGRKPQLFNIEKMISIQEGEQSNPDVNSQNGEEENSSSSFSSGNRRRGPHTSLRKNDDRTLFCKGNLRVSNSAPSSFFFLLLPSSSSSSSLPHLQLSSLFSLPPSAFAFFLLLQNFSLTHSLLRTFSSIIIPSSL
jgi:hypothetical protein